MLSPELVEQLTAASDASLGEQDASHFEDNVSSGSMILIDWNFFNSFVSPRTPPQATEMFRSPSLMPRDPCAQPVFADLVAEPGVVASLQELGFAEPKFGHGRIISKPPHSPQLYWCAHVPSPRAS